ncbi:hypothetical protein [Streptomyces bluensis]|uniref:hypothetical protein n=1 Tax=Streptomyces bluensis TaxID=33897 RepID=UPI0016750FE0|nr:hypothetical protein [Streptomyces bluensis]GGZ92828.1 hypothetical protein GCM10010344_70640 [Streptomyces bluensis]
MGPRLLFEAFDDIRGRCDIASVRLTRNESGYDDGALVPGSDWNPITADDAKHLRADGATPDSVLIELVHRPLPESAPDALEARLETAARLDPPRWPLAHHALGCAASPGNWALAQWRTAFDYLEAVLLQDASKAAASGRILAAPGQIASTIADMPKN